MQVTWEMRDYVMHIYLHGELDHHAARETLGQIGKAIDQNLPMQAVLNLTGLSFMDSSGIAVLLGTKRRLDAFGGKLTVTNAPKQASRVLHTAGIDKMVRILA